MLDLFSRRILGWPMDATIDHRHYIIVPTDDEFDQLYLTYAGRALKYLQSLGLPKGKIVIVSSAYSARDRTFLSAVLVKEWFNRRNIEVRSIDVFSGCVHSRRSRNLYQLAFGDDVSIGILASKSKIFDLSLWWQSSYAATQVVNELIGLMLIKCCFNPAKEGLHYEKQGIYKQE